MWEIIEYYPYIAPINHALQRPCVVDIVNPHEPHELAVILCTYQPIVALLTACKLLKKILTESRCPKLCLTECDYVLFTSRRYIRCQHTIYIELICVTYHLGKREIFSVGRLFYLFLIMVIYGKA